MHLKDSKDMLPIFMLSYQTSIHETTNMMPAISVFRWELRLPRGLLIGAPLSRISQRLLYD